VFTASVFVAVVMLVVVVMMTGVMLAVMVGMVVRHSCIQFLEMLMSVVKAVPQRTS